MSTEVRNTALVHAIETAKITGNNAAAEHILAIARDYEAYLNGSQLSEQPKAEKPKAEKLKAEKPKAPTKQIVDMETAVPITVITKEDVGAVVERLLNANLREGAVAVLKKYGANSVSGLMATGKVAEAYADLQALLIAE